MLLRAENASRRSECDPRRSVDMQAASSASGAASAPASSGAASASAQASGSGFGDDMRKAAEQQFSFDGGDAGADGRAPAFSISDPSMLAPLAKHAQTLARAASGGLRPLRPGRELTFLLHAVPPVHLAIAPAAIRIKNGLARGTHVHE
mgnify:CR=1 FL=1